MNNRIINASNRIAHSFLLSPSPAILVEEINSNVGSASTTTNNSGEVD